MAFLTLLGGLVVAALIVTGAFAITKHQINSNKGRKRK